MKHTYKHAKISLTLILLVFAFLCVFNVTYSYFTSTTKIQGTGKFAGLEIQFVYYDSAGSLEDDYVGEMLTLYPVPKVIARNEAFEFSLTPDGEIIDGLAIRNPESSSPCYVRFWIDAYLLDENGDPDKTENFGKYFLLEQNDAFYTNKNSSSQTAWYYYVIDAIEPTDSDSIVLGNQLTLSDLNVGEANEDLVPARILGEKMIITISVQAVQATNGAFLEEFKDGYLKDIWK